MSNDNGVLVHREQFKYKIKRALGIYLLNRFINRIGAWLV